ncbi:MAG: choice-of-anchor D domain-containing protein [Myxococcales bacterium]|jgi:hypothetical protein
MRRALLLAVPVAVALAACSDPPTPLVKARCQSDDDCDQGQLCEDGICVPRDAFRCDAVTSGMGILQPSPHIVDFGAVGPTLSEQEITLRNIGDCALTVFEVNFGAGEEGPFTCEGCGEESFPIEIFPMREYRLKVSFAPAGVGSFADKLLILSDDAEFPELQVPLRAHFDGVPELRATPGVIDFGYVAVGREGSRTLRLANAGNGTAQLGIRAVRIDPASSDAFSVEGSPAETLQLAPLSVDQRAGLTVTVLYHPREVGSHEAFVVVETDSESVGVVSLPIRGTSETPPVLSVSPDQVVFGEAQIGKTVIERITVVNQGGSPLMISHRWATGLSTDFMALPAVVEPIDPGRFIELEVLLTPTATGQLSGVLVLESNDPSRASISIPVSATGVNQLGTQVVKIELAYENGSDSAFDEDLRNVDLTLEHPYGFVCNKHEPNPQNWDEFGTPSWLAYGVKEEPERIILVDPQRDGTYRVMLHYVQDCAALPTDLLASLLGLSVEALAGGLSSGTIQLDGEDIGNMIENTCFSRSATTAMVTVYVNGSVIAEVPATLHRRGDFVYAFNLVRQNGQFRLQ